MSTARIENHIPGGIANASILGHCAISEDDSYALISVLPEDLQLDLSCANTGELINTYCIFVDAAVSQDIRCFVRVDVQTICLFETELVGQQRQFNLRYSDLKFFSDYPERIIVRVEIFHQQDYILTLELNHTITIGDSAKTTVNFCKTSPPIASFGNPKVTSFIKGNLLPYFNEITNNTPINITLAVVYNHLLNVNENFFHYGRINFNDFLDDYSNQDFVVNKSSGFGLCNLKAHFVAQFFDCNASVLGLDNDNTLLDFSHVSNEPEETSLIREFLVKSPEEKIKIFNLIRFPKSAIKIYSLLLEKIFLRYNNFWNVQFDAEVLIKEDRYLKTILSDVELGVPLFCRNSYTSNARKFFNMSWTPYIQDIAKCVHRRIDVPFIYEILAIKVIDIRSGRPLENKRVKRIRIIRQAELYSDLVILSYTPTFNDAAPNNCPLRYRLNLGNNNRYKTTRDALRSFGYPVQETTTDTADNEDNEDIEDNEDNEFDDTDRASITHYLRDRGVTETEVADISAETTNTKLDNIITYIIRDFENCLETDELGTLNIMIPKGYMDDHRVAIQLGFYEFPIIEERDEFIRPGSHIAPTNFEIRWNLPDGEQQIDGWEQLIDWAQIDTPENNPTSRHFGWEVTFGSTSYGNYLKTCLYKVIKNNYDEFKFFPPGPHFDSIEHPFHMILFGMVWCQPVWDNVPDSPNNARSNERTFINRLSIRNVNMHIVTKEVGGTLNPYGHYYGFWNSSSNPHRTYQAGNIRPHRGIDLYSGDNGDIPCFAIKGGRTSRHTTEQLGHRVDLRITRNDVPLYRYYHLLNDSGITKSVVMSGEQIGICGRTGSTVSNQTPSHLHIELRKTNSGFYNGDAEPNNLDDIEYDDNIKNMILPSNQLPLMLPCQCHFGNNPSVINCTFSERNIISTCWAVQEFPYNEENIMHQGNIITRENYSSNNNPQSHPHPIVDNNGVLYYACPNILSGNAHANSALQAKLRFLYFNRGRGAIPNADFFNPGVIDGSIGRAPTRVAVNGLTQNQQLTLAPGTNQHFDGLLIRVQFPQPNGTTVTGWIESDLLDEEYRLAISHLNSFINSVVSNTRMAIYMFKKSQERLDYSEYDRNFSMNDEDNIVLNNLAQYFMPE